jgi:hypothetical protein
LLWLSIEVLPLLEDSKIPVQVDHYSTLVVQGFNLLLLQGCILSGWVVIHMLLERDVNAMQVV